MATTALITASARQIAASHPSLLFMIARSTRPSLLTYLALLYQTGWGPSIQRPAQCFRRFTGLHTSGQSEA